MSRKALSALFSLILTAPAFSAPVEAVGLRASPVALSAPAALFGPSLLAPLVGSATRPTPVPPPFVPGALQAPVAAAASAAQLEAPRDPASARVAETVARTAGSWGVPVEEILENADVLLIGENHRGLSAFKTLAREMPRLARAGVRAVGLEGLKRPHQKAVDDYVSGRTRRVPREALTFSASRVDALKGLLKSARENGVRVVALGLPLQDWAAQVSALAAEKAGEPAESFPTTLAEQIDRAESGYEHGYNEAVVEVVLTRRNRSMARFLWGALGAGEKAVVVAGQAHVPGPDQSDQGGAVRLRVRADPGDLARELTALALRSYALTFTGGLFADAEAARDDREVRPRAHAAAAAASPRGAPVFVPLAPDQGLWHAGGRIPAGPVAR